MSNEVLADVRFTVSEGQERKLSSWKETAKQQINKWLNDQEFADTITNNTMKKEWMGPFTKFLYWFASSCECGWGVMVDFDERKQRVFLTNLYYNWMHSIRDEILSEAEENET